LRARIWQSIFTHDMYRYLRALYPRMGDIITLITGPSGSGKELVARAIALSRYIPFDEKERQFTENFIETFYPINLTALSPTLIESELFGHRKGAFTGALQDRQGYLEKSGSCGTVFLDEVGDVDPVIQIKLLRLLQTRGFQRLGDTELLPFEGKIMAATNKDLVAEIENGSFREDFYYRLCADQVETPALKDILSGDGDELPYLVRYISEQVAGPAEADALTEEVCTWITRQLGPTYTWPGNFRELEQCVRNILVHREYHPHLVSTHRSITDEIESGHLSADALLKAYATRIYAEVGDYKETARRLELDPRTVKKYIDPDALQRIRGK
jgi:DNA-binding NtrC family response regulator